MFILGIETSCDETAASVAEIKNGKINILSNIISSQIELHKKYGGVIPELAAREHVLNIIPVVNEALKKAKINYKKLNAIAIASGPGLITSLMCGVESAKTLAYIWKKPLIKINHIEGHIYANWLNNKKINFPAIALTVSGGHTILVLMKNHLNYKIIGETRDDAAGEAFDKAAKLLNIGYPGGPIVSRLAELSLKKDIKLPRPMMHDDNFDFSFSGLKTALFYQLKKDPNWTKRVNDYCYEFEKAVSDVLIKKTIKAAKKYKVKTVMLSGGVSANKVLRNNLEIAVKTKLIKTAFSMPDLKYTTDNAAMITAVGYFKYKEKKFTPWRKLTADPNLGLL